MGLGWASKQQTGCGKSQRGLALRYTDPRRKPQPSPGSKGRGSHSPMVRLGMLAKMRSVAVL